MREVVDPMHFHPASAVRHPLCHLNLEWLNQHYRWISYPEQNTPSRSMPGSSFAPGSCGLVAVLTGSDCLEGLRDFFHFLYQHIVGCDKRAAVSATLIHVGTPCLMRMAGWVQTRILTATVGNAENRTVLVG